MLRFVGPFVYLRLHRSAYGPEAMATWAARARDLLAQGRDVYAYFTHEDGAPAPAYAQTLARLVAGTPEPDGGSTRRMGRTSGACC
ncbi:MAG: DUF72 domain-containing protein [Armatimonadota bacterium]|nr:DUF72 domain-containing protein [Armatimonadota bacterium]